MLFNTIVDRQTHSIGIDALRITAMIMITLLHTLGQGGVLANVSMLSPKWALAWLLEIFSFGAVNCYALISGFVGYKSGFKPHKLIILWFRVIFYTVGILCVFIVLYPEMVNSFTIKKSIIPFVMGHYWYVTAYAGAFFLMPLINKAVTHLTYVEGISITIITLIVYVFWPAFNNVDMLNFKYGYSAFWLLYLYFIGAFLGKFGNTIKIGKSNALIGYILCIFLSWSCYMLTAYMGKIGFSSFGSFTKLFVDYTSPLLLLGAIYLVHFFSRINISGNVVQYLVKAFAPATLSVYLIHVNCFIWEKYIHNFAVPFTKCGTGEMIAKIMLSAFSIYIACSMIDFVRIIIFRSLDIEGFCIKLSDAWCNIGKKIFKDII